MIIQKMHFGEYMLEIFLIWKVINLPQLVGNYSDWLMSNRDPTKKLFGEEDSLRPDANCGGSNGDMSSLSDAD